MRPGRREAWRLACGHVSRQPRQVWTRWSPAGQQTTVFTYCPKCPGNATVEGAVNVAAARIVIRERAAA